MTHHITRTAAVVTALAALGVAGCGGDDTKTAADDSQTQANATATQTQTQTQTQTTGTTATTEQREAVVPGEQATLSTGDIGLKVKVDKVLDPAAAAVDRAQPGKKLVGVFVTGQTTGVVEPTRTTALTALETTDGKVTGIRIIADGDCGGGFSANELLLATKKPVTGCIGFEIPKKATPKAITITLASEQGTQQASWELPPAQ